MTIHVNIPQPFEDALRAEWGDLDQAARDALLIESYRTGRLSIGQIAQILGFSTRHEAEEWLGARGVHWNYSIEELRADRETIARLLGESA